MMHIIEALIELEAAARNGEVIGLAFKEASIHCPNCLYPENAHEFDVDLQFYTERKKALHRVNRKIERHYEYCNGHACWVAWKRCSECSDLKAIRNQILKLTRSLRVDLTQHWPCVECMKLYNPTRRWNHPPKLTPIREEFINVRFD
jgi:hypothetical protein